MLPVHAVAFDDDSSPCGGALSRVTFPAAGGVAYWVVVEGWGATNCGSPAITVTIGNSATPPTLPPPTPPSPPPPKPPPPSPSPLSSSPPSPSGSCGTPLTMAGLPSSGVSIFNPSATTCGAANSWSCRGSRDFLYLLPSSSMARNITLDTCVSGVAAWDSFLYVIPVQPNTCFQCTTAVAFDDDSSPCGGALSRVTFPAAGGVAYWVVVEGWGATNCGSPAITVTIGNSATPPTLPPPTPPSPPPPKPPPPSPSPLSSSPPSPSGSCGTPLTMAGLPSSGVSIFNPSATTCGAANSWSCRGSRDFLYLLPSSSMARNITLDTCVSGVAAWDSFLYVIPVQPNTCFQCTTAVAFDDDSSPCGGALSRVTFPAAGGVAYWVVVEGWGATNCGSPAITVTIGNSATPPTLPPPTPPSPPPPKPPPPSPSPLSSSPPSPSGSCGTPLTMAGLPSSGVSIFNPSTTTCGAANSWSCRGSRDFLYLLPSSSMARNITLDTCVSGVAAWDSFLYVIPVQPNTCFQCTTAVAFDDDSSPCGGALSRVTFPAAGGVAYWVVVEGWGTTNCGSPAITVTTS
ncbi:hypothetical protein V8C86DRAFT_1464880 [Haematococcus lacustris]